MKLGTVPAGFDVDGYHVGSSVGDDGAAIPVGGADVRAGKLPAVEFANFVGRIAAFERGSDGVHAAESGAGGAVLLNLCSGIDINAQIFGGLVGIFGSFHGAEGSFDFDVLAILGDVGLPGDAETDNGEHGNAENTKEDDRANHDEDSLEAAAAA